MEASLRGGDGREALKPPTPDPLPAGPPKDKGGRPSKAKKAERERAEAEALAQQREKEAEELSLIATETLALPFSYVAKRRGGHWELSEEEKGRFSLAVSRVVVKYLPGLLMKYKEEAALLLIGVAIIVPRMRQDKEIRIEREARSRAVRRDGHPGMRQDDAGEADSGPSIAG